MNQKKHEGIRAKEGKGKLDGEPEENYALQRPTEGRDLNHHLEKVDEYGRIEGESGCFLNNRLIWHCHKLSFTNSSIIV